MNKNRTVCTQASHPHQLEALEDRRLFSAGARDGSFSEDGKVHTDIGFRCEDMVIDAQGRIILAGKGTHPGGYVMSLARFRGDGSLDTTFDGDGKRIIDTYLFYGEGTAVTMDYS